MKYFRCGTLVELLLSIECKNLSLDSVSAACKTHVIYCQLEDDQWTTSYIEDYLYTSPDMVKQITSITIEPGAEAEVTIADA